MVNTVIFDVGQVLVDFRWRELFHELGFEGEKFEKMAEATVHNPWWNEFDRGCMTFDELVDRYCETAPDYREDILKLYAHGDEFIRLREFTIPWIRDLKARGYKVYILSNWSEPVFEANKDTHLRFLSEVDGEVFSYREKLLKPEREIYELICNRYGFAPEEAAFIDDNAANIAAANAFGIHGIQFLNEAQAKEELEKILEEK